MKKQKYTEQDVRNICELLGKAYSTKEIIETYPNLNSSFIARVRQKKCWKEVSDEYFIKIEE